MSATAAHSSRRSSRHKAKEEASVKEEESNDLTEISNVQLVREAIEEDQDDINSPLRSMRNLEDVTMTFNTNTVIKETDNANKTRMKTPDLLVEYRRKVVKGYREWPLRTTTGTKGLRSNLVPVTMKDVRREYD